MRIRFADVSRQRSRVPRRRIPLVERLEDRSLLAVASLVGNNLQVSFTSTGTTAEFVEIRHNGATISVQGNIGEASFSATLVNQITVNDTGGSSNQSLLVSGGKTFVLSGGFSSTGVEQFETLGTYDFSTGATHVTSVVTSGSGVISIQAPRIIVVRNSTSLISENGGIALVANPLGAATNFAGIHIAGLIESRGTGAINITGKGSPANGTQNLHGVVIDQSGIVRSTSTTNLPTQGTITIQGEGNGVGKVGVAIGLSAGGTVLSHAGNITIVGQGGNGHIQNQGVAISNGANVTGLNGAAISITGTAGNGATSSGVAITAATVQTRGGDITITGTGGAALSPTDANNPGIQAIGSSLFSTSGAIQLNGTGGTSASSNMGIYAISSPIQSSSGPVSLLGIAGTSSQAISIDNQLPISSGVSVTLTGDSLAIPNVYFAGPHVSAPLVTIEPRTLGTRINLGGGDVISGSPLVLGLADHELDDIRANTLRIGDADAGTISVVVANTPPVNVAWDVELVTGGDIHFSAPLSTVGFFNSGSPTRGNLLLVPGPAGSVLPKVTSSDVVTQTNTGGAFTTSFAPGSDLTIHIAGLTPHTEYDRLTALGAVNLTGADLALTGGFVSSTGNVFTIVSATSVAGIFNALPDNSHVIFNGRVLRVNYSPTTATLSDIGPAPSIDLAGRVFDDANNDGLFDSSDAGIGGVSVQLFDESNLAIPLATTLTAADGTYLFDANLSVGSYRLVAEQPLEWLDGKETAGSLGGTVNNAADSNTIQGIVVGLDSGITVAGGYSFAEIRSSRVQGLVWEDASNNGEVDFGEQVIGGVAIRLTGNDDRGAMVDLLMQTDSQGLFEFLQLRPSDTSGYTLTETQPAGFVDGPDIVGTVNGTTKGSNTTNDVISQIAMTQPGSDAINFNFAELPAISGGLRAGQTATIGFWQNKNGQALIMSLNGGPSATQLSDWLAATFPNMYGADAGPNDLTGRTNAEVAEFYQTLFKRNAKTAAGSGAPKVDAQVLAVALAVYVTNQNLAGAAAVSYGFTVDAYGAGAATFNVGENGAAFGVADGSEVRVLDLLLAVDSRSANGLLYDQNGDGDTNDLNESLFRTMANDIFGGINEAGDIG